LMRMMFIAKPRSTVLPEDKETYQANSTEYNARVLHFARQMNMM